MHATPNDSDTASEYPYWHAYAQRISDNGYRIVPTVGKRALVPNWPTYQFAPIDAERYKFHNVGILTALTPALDVDCLDPVEAEFIAGFILSALPQAKQAMVRVGQSPKFALLFRTERPFRKCAIRLERAGARMVVEWLGQGQQMVAFGRHPAGHEYSWTTMHNPLNTGADALPEVNGMQAASLLGQLQVALGERGWRIDSGAPAPNYEAAGEAIATARELPPMPPVEGLPEVLWRALNVLDPTPREQWIAVGHHLKAINADWAFGAWLAWSQRSPAYQPGDEDRWDTFRVERSSGSHALQVMAGVREDPTEDFEVVEPRRPRAAGRTLIEWPAVAEARAPSWVIRGVLERDAVGVVWGDPRSFKSFLVLSWLLSVAHGVPWHGRPVKQGRVVYVCGEGRGGVMRRVRAWQDHHGIEGGLGDCFGISRGAIHLNAEQDVMVDRLITELRAAGIHPSVLAVDTVARNMIGNENAQEDMNALVRVLDKLRRAFPGCTIILVHHANKQGAIRGSTVLVGAADFEYQCVRDEKLGRMVVRVECRKMKDADEPEPMVMKAQVVQLGLETDDFGDEVEVTSLVLEPTVVQVNEEGEMDDVLLQAVREANEAGRRPSGTELAEGRGRKQDVLDALRRMKERGQLKGGEGTGRAAVGYWLPEFDVLFD